MGSLWFRRPSPLRRLWIVQRCRLSPSGRVFTIDALARQGINLPLTPTQQSSLQTVGATLPTLIDNQPARAAIGALPPNRAIALGDPNNPADAVGNASPVFVRLPGDGFSIGLPRDPEGRSQGVVTYLTPADNGQRGSRARPFSPATGNATGYDSGHGIPLRAGGPGDIPQLLLIELRNNNRGSVRSYEDFLADRLSKGAEIVYTKIPIILSGNNGDIPDYIVQQAWSPNQGWALPPVVFQNY